MKEGGLDREGGRETEGLHYRSWIQVGSCVSIPAYPLMNVARGGDIFMCWAADTRPELVLGEE